MSTDEQKAELEQAFAWGAATRPKPPESRPMTDEIDENRCWLIDQDERD